MKPQRRVLVALSRPEEGHKRATQAEEFVVLGGDTETHERMTEVCMKTMEDLKKGGDNLQSVDPQKLGDYLRKHGS